MRKKLINLQIFLLLSLISIVVPTAGFTNPDETDVLIKEVTMTFHNSVADLAVNESCLALNNSLITGVSAADYYYEQLYYNLLAEGFTATEEAEYFFFRITEIGNGWAIGKVNLHFVFKDSDNSLSNTRPAFRNDSICCEQDGEYNFTHSITGLAVNDCVVHFYVRQGTVDFDCSMIMNLYYYRIVANTKMYYPETFLPPDYTFLILGLGVMVVVIFKK